MRNLRFLIGAVLIGGVAYVALRRSPPSSPVPTPSASSSAAPLSSAAPIGRATVKAFEDGTPAADRWVVFHDATGAVMSFTKTGKDGRASGAIAKGSMVTVADVTSIHNLITVRDVEPDDELVFGESEDDEGGETASVCNVMVQLPNAHPKAAKHIVSLGVGPNEVPDPKTPLKLAVLPRYIKKGKFPVFAEALDAGGGPIAFAHASVGGCVADAGAVNVRLPDWTTDYRTFSVVATGAPPSTTFNAELRVLSSEYDHLSRGRREGPLTDPLSVAFPVPRPLGEELSYKLSVNYDGALDHAVVFERREEMPERIEVDLRARLLPRVSNAEVEGAATPRPTVKWRVVGAPAKLDAVVARISWPSTRENVWTIVAPPDSEARLVIPALPNELASLRPDGRAITAGVAVVEASYLNGYKDLRTKGLDVLHELPDEETVELRYSATGDLDF